MTTTAKTPHSVIACTHCRAGKKRCGGEKPSCTRCVVKGRQCEWPSHDADARKPPRKAYVAALLARIDALEAELAARPAASTSGMALAPAVQQLPQVDFHLLDRPQLLAGFDSHQRLRSFGPSSPISMLSQIRPSLNRLVTPVTPPPLEPQNDDPIAVPQGPFPSPAFSPLALSEELHTELLLLSFAFASSHSMQYEPHTFLRDYMRAHSEQNWTPTPTWSPAMHLGILAVGARYLSHRVELRAQPSNSRSAGLAFAEAGKAQLWKELETPTLSTLRACQQVGTFYSATGHDSYSCIMFGMAIRLSQDMGLNLDTTPLVATGAVTHSLCRARQWTFWNIMISDCMWGLWLGRRCSFDPDEITVPLPEICPAIEYMPWVRPGYGAGFGSFSSYFRYMCELCLILNRVLELRCSPRQWREDYTSEVSRLSLSLESWLKDLPASLRLSVTSQAISPPVFILYGIYMSSIILLFKPLWRHLGDQHARKRCMEAANESVAIMNHFCRLYGAEMGSVPMPHILEKAALVYQSLCAEATEATDPDLIRTWKRKYQECVVIMHQMGETWELSDSIAVLLEGVSLEEGSKDPATSFNVISRAVNRT